MRGRGDGAVTDQVAAAPLPWACPHDHHGIGVLRHRIRLVPVCLLEMGFLKPISLLGRRAAELRAILAPMPMFPRLHDVDVGLRLFSQHSFMVCSKVEAPLHVCQTGHLQPVSPFHFVHRQPLSAAPILHQCLPAIGWDPWLLHRQVLGWLEVVGGAS